jgi:hypothetical protein
MNGQTRVATNSERPTVAEQAHGTSELLGVAVNRISDWLPADRQEQVLTEVLRSARPFPTEDGR